MSVTAEQVQLLQRFHQLPLRQAQTLLDTMRREGCRMENTLKNVGQAGYAFNWLQRQLLPDSLRPLPDMAVAGLQT